MACGCGRKSGIYRSAPSTIVNRNQNSNLRQQAVPPPSARTTNTAIRNAEERRTQALRRDAIRKALNK